MRLQFRPAYGAVISLPLHILQEFPYAFNIRDAYPNSIQIYFYFNLKINQKRGENRPFVRH